MVETIENYYLFIEAEKRVKSEKDSDYINHEQIMQNLNITKNELKDIEVEIE